MGAGRAKPAKMKALVLHAARDLRIEDRETKSLGAGQVRVRIATGGICGSDLHYYHHGGFGTVHLREPMVLGHEVSGHITELGAGVEGLSVGELVAVSPSRPCGDCRYCLKGVPNHCLNMRFYGSAMPIPHVQGAFREEIVAEAWQCAPADGLNAGEAAMAEPLAVCLHALRNAGPILGKSALVTGCGPIGVLTILCLRRAGADRIVATDLSDFTLAQAKAAGADEVINVAENAEAVTAFAENKGTFDVHFECSGAAAALASGIQAMRPRGTIVQLGMSGDMALPMLAITVKELRLQGSFRFHEEFFTGVSLMRKGLIDVKPLITHTLPMAEAVAAFDLAADRSRTMKAQLLFA